MTIPQQSVTYGRKVTNYTSMAEYLYNVDWSELFSTNFTPDDIWSAFSKRLDEAIELFVPAVEARSHPNTRIRHYPRHIRKLLAHKLTI